MMSGEARNVGRKEKWALGIAWSRIWERSVCWSKGSTFGICEMVQVRVGKTTAYLPAAIRTRHCESGDRPTTLSRIPRNLENETQYLDKLEEFEKSGGKYEDEA
jgi:hypothetical protein